MLVLVSIDMSIIPVTMIRRLLFLLRKESLAAARHLPARRPDGSPWKYRTVLPPHIGRLLDAHMDTLGGIDKKDSANLFFDISQKPDYRKKTIGKVLPAAVATRFACWLHVHSLRTGPS